MSSRIRRVAEWIETFQGQDLDARYLAYFECFNQQLYFEAHDVLEALWLVDRHAPDSAFYKGLIQLAGAFVHLQKGRIRPASSLFKLARASLHQYPPLHQRLNLIAVLEMIKEWLQRLESEPCNGHLLAPEAVPQLRLEARAA